MSYRNVGLLATLMSTVFAGKYTPGFDRDHVARGRKARGERPELPEWLICTPAQEQARIDRAVAKRARKAAR